MSASFITPGLFSQAMYGSQQSGLLESAFNGLLSIELDGSRMDAGRMGEFATRVASAITDHYEKFSAALSLTERQNLERVAESSGIEPRAATVEYLSNDYLFRTIRDYFDLPPKDFFSQLDRGGFLVFTINGSIVASPPEERSWRRTFHYTRMPSRTNTMETSTRRGELESDIAVGHRLRSTAFNSSAIRSLVNVPANQAQLFDAVQESMTSASVSVSMFITRSR